MRAAAMGIVLASMLASMIVPAAARAQCVVRSTGSLPRVRIEPPGVPAFEIAIDAPNEVEVVATGGERARVRAVRPLRFEGSADVRGLALRPARPIVAASGVLTLDRDAELRASALGAREATVDVPLVGGTAIGAQVPCRSLRLAPTEDGSMVTRERGAAPAGAPSVIATDPTLEVRARARGPVVLTIRVDDAELMWMSELRREGDAVEILLTGHGTTTVRGWVDAGAIRSTDGPVVGDGAGLGGVGHGCGRGGSGYHYRGPATLVSGAELRAAPEGPVWARAASDLEVTVAIERAGGWVQVERIAGIRGIGGTCATVLEIAWVPSDAVRLPAAGGR